MATQTKHEQVRLQLEEMIAHELEPGDMLPGERHLEEAFGVSRITVRRAIGDLVASGKLTRSRGRGTFVAPTPLSTQLALASFSTHMAAEGLKATSKVLIARLEPAPPEVLAHLGTGDHIHLKRVRLGNERPYAIDDAWYNATCIPDLLSHDVTDSVYGLLDDAGVPVTDADQRASAVAANEDQARDLDVEVGSPLLNIIRWSNSDGRPIEHCSSVYRPDRFTLRAHAARV
ncbi:MAG: GntR family transcriptional regulator [Corynebacterium sp.]|nr:GntR family transcriptional regulator [Corynebacterium sp.]